MKRFISQVALVFGLIITPLGFTFPNAALDQGSELGAPSPLWFDLEPGPFRVGFQVLYRYDNTRSFETKRLKSSDKSHRRPIRVMIWYPAEHSTDQGHQVMPMRFGDYLTLESPEPSFAQFNRMMQERDEVTTYRQFAGFHLRDLARQLMYTSVAAYLDAPPAKGSFPVVMHSTGRNNFQQESTVLWEYLASHGYVVASVPQLGFSPAKRHLNFALPDIQLQQKDIEFALEEVSRFANADAGRIATMGHGSGGVVSLLVAANKRNVVAVVSLDGELTRKEGIAIVESAGVNPEQFRASLLAMYRERAEHPIELTLLNSLSQVDRYYLSFVKATHFDFENWPLYSVLTNTVDERGRGVRPATTGRDNYLIACRSVREFLDAVVKGSNSPMLWFTSISGDHVSDDQRLVKFSFQKASTIRSR